MSKDNTQLNAMADSYDVLVCGGGIRGLMSAQELSKQGLSVCLIESSPRLGGVLNSIPWKDYFLDIGCHLFDNSTEELTRQFFEIHSKFHPVDVTYHSVMSDNGIAQDMAAPDLTLMGAKDIKVIASLESVQNEKNLEIDNYHDFLTQRFGEYNTDFLRQCIRKKTTMDTVDLCRSAENVVLMNRVKMLSSERSKELKKQNFYDERLAVASAKQPMMHYSAAAEFYAHRNFYPSEGGMGSFCQSFETYLEKQGVKILKNEKVNKIHQDGRVYTDSQNIIKADKIIWAGELALLQQILLDSSSMMDLMCPVAAALVYFEVPEQSVSDITYLHDYRLNSPCYRISTAGKYSRQIIAGNTYVCGEVFMQTNSPLWRLDESNCDSVWQQVRELGVVNCEKPLDVKVIKTPCAYRLPTVGYAQSSELFSIELAERYSNIVTFKQPSFSKQKIYTEVKDLVSSLKKTFAIS